MDQLLERMNATLEQPPANVLFLAAKKRGRPKRDETPECAQHADDPALGDGAQPKSPRVKLLKKEKATSKKAKSKKKKEGEKSNQHASEHLLQWTQKLRIPSKQEPSPTWVPAFKFCQLYSCPWCQGFSWDLKRCTGCKRLVPTDAKFLTVENSEILGTAVDKLRPLFHAPPVPYYQPGIVKFCTNCFYFTSSSDHSVSCGTPIHCFEIIFSRHNSDKEYYPEFMIRPFEARKVGVNLIECPYCFFSTDPELPTCIHCVQTIPLFVLIRRKGVASNDNIFDMVWPPKAEILNGVIKTLPPKYLPVYKENMVATCPWCSSLGFDLFRCSTCLRQMPKVKNLVTLQDNSKFGVCYGPARPIYDPPPVPYYRPGKMMVCSSCNNMSRSLRLCDSCGEKPKADYAAVEVNFKSAKLTGSNEEKIVQFFPRKINDGALFVCPFCDLSTDKKKCIHCGRLIPTQIKVSKLSKAVARKGRNLQGKIIPGRFKTNSLVREDPLINSGAFTKKHMLQDVDSLPQDYVPRFRETGVVQCNSCLAWSWDFDRCSHCYRSIDLSGALILFPKANFSHLALEDKRPVTKNPIPCLALGRRTLCPGCLCFVWGPPDCPECGTLIPDDCDYYNIETLESNDCKTDNVRLVKFQPRTLKDKSLVFCIFCGFSSENFKVCSVCSKPFPQHCAISSIDGSSKLPQELVFVKRKTLSCSAPAPAKKAKQQEEEEKVESLPVEPVPDVVAELIRIDDWQAAVGLTEKTEAQKWLESFPFAVDCKHMIDTTPVSCFPDEIFELSGTHLD